MSSNKLLDFENTCGAYPLVFSCPEDSSFFYILETGFHPSEGKRFFVTNEKHHTEKELEEEYSYFYCFFEKNAEKKFYLMRKGFVPNEGFADEFIMKPEVSIFHRKRYREIAFELAEGDLGRMNISHSYIRLQNIQNIIKDFEGVVKNQEKYLYGKS